MLPVGKGTNLDGANEERCALVKSLKGTTFFFVRKKTLRKRKSKEIGGGFAGYILRFMTDI